MDSILDVLRRIEGQGWAAIAAFVAAAVAFAQFRQNFRLREREFRWRRAEMAKQLLDDLFDDGPADQALEILDELHRPVPRSDGSAQPISKCEIRDALTFPFKSSSDINDYIRERFDALFFHLDRLAHFIRIGLIEFEDVRAPSEYFTGLLAENHELYREYFERIGYARAEEFLSNFESWPKKSAA